MAEIDRPTRPASVDPVDDLVVVGAGPIGLTVAWRAAQRGLTVSVYDPDPGAGAGYAAAGMIAPVAEATFGERPLTELLLASAASWPAFARDLEAATGLDIGYRTEGTLVVALTADDLAEADRLRSYQEELGLPISALRPSRLREREPLLAPRIRGGAHAPDDHQVDPRRLVTALRVACLAAGVRLIRSGIPALSHLASPARPSPRAVLVAAGCGSAALTGLPVRPVKGQILRLRAPDGQRPGFSHVIRGYADGRHVYLVPRPDGEVVVGATMEERVDSAVTAGAVLDLLRAATDLVPALAEYELVEACVRHRPGTPDNAPLLGRLPSDWTCPGWPAGPDRPDLYVATGHHRHGILLAPLTGDVMVDAVTGTGTPPALAPFTPTRFTPAVPPPARAKRRAPCPADQGERHTV